MSPRKRGRVMLLLVGLLGLLSLAACALPGSANIQGTPGRRAGKGDGGHGTDAHSHAGHGPRQHQGLCP